MYSLKKFIDLFRLRPGKVRTGPPNSRPKAPKRPRPVAGRRIPREYKGNEFKKCDKCGRTFAKEKLKHIKMVNQHLCKDCLGVLMIYMNNDLPYPDGELP